MIIAHRSNGNIPPKRLPGSLADWQEGGFGIYIHWPFCQSRCPYCDFNTYIFCDKLEQQLWCDAYLSEIDQQASWLEPRRLDTIYFGGGTPSLMDPEKVATIIAHIKSIWQVSDQLEVTLEANPSSAECANLSLFAQAGVNRLSLGVQSLNDEALKLLGRNHSAKQAIKAYEMARRYFKRVNIDLIYALPGQNLEDWRQQLLLSLQLAPEHLSLYQLTIKTGTSFYKLAKAGKLATTPDDMQASLYELTQTLCAKAGLPAYEISNHARPQAQSQHNLLYWRYGDYMGIGPGAHGRLTIGGQRHSLLAMRSPEDWLSAALKGDDTSEKQPLSLEEQLHEYLLLGMRLREGISLARAENLLGSKFAEEDFISLQREGVLLRQNDRICATERGILLLDHVVAKMDEVISSTEGEYV